mmetsp:Transcript_32707/g.82016  ORF Transcript_32707/g.82016 Transcript_32707/m.82016 type:complete len:213 (-) Transcript_32707:524-1162(-)
MFSVSLRLLRLAFGLLPRACLCVVLWFHRVLFQPGSRRGIAHHGLLDRDHGQIPCRARIRGFTATEARIVHRQHPGGAAEGAGHHLGTGRADREAERDASDCGSNRFHGTKFRCCHRKIGQNVLIKPFLPNVRFGCLDKLHKVAKHLAAKAVGDHNRRCVVVRLSKSFEFVHQTREEPISAFHDHRWQPKVIGGSNHVLWTIVEGLHQSGEQ